MDFIRQNVVGILAIFVAVPQTYFSYLAHLRKQPKVTARGAVGQANASHWLGTWNQYVTLLVLCALAWAPSVFRLDSSYDLHGDLMQTAGGGQSDIPDDSARLTIWMKIKNVGDRPSVADNFRVVATLYGHPYVGAPVGFSSINFRGEGFSKEVPGSENILERAAKPIPVGGEVVGVLSVVFPSTPANLFEAMTPDFVVSFDDVSGHSYSVSPETHIRAKMPGYIAGEKDGPQ